MGGYANDGRAIEKVGYTCSIPGPVVRYTCRISGPVVGNNMQDTRLSNVGILHLQDNKPPSGVCI